MDKFKVICKDIVYWTGQSAAAAQERACEVAQEHKQNAYVYQLAQMAVYTSKVELKALT